LVTAPSFLVTAGLDPAVHADDDRKTAFYQSRAIAWRTTNQIDFLVSATRKGKAASFAEIQHGLPGQARQ
jgi:hypothetical protein